jgi:hypothetical protein
MKNFLIEIAAIIIFSITRLINILSFPKILNGEIIKQLDKQNNPAIYVFWHGRFALMNFIKPKNMKAYGVVSKHTDGELIARVIKKFGFESIRGSTNRVLGENGKPAKDRGGTKAIRDCIKILKQNNILFITPDGPRGPERKFKENLLFIAKMSGAPVVPISFTCKQAIKLNTWDRFLYPLPFSKPIIKCGEPFYINKNATEEEMQQTALKIEQKLNELSNI